MIGKNEGPGVMAINLVLPIGRLPIGQRPGRLEGAGALQPFVQPVEAEGKQAVFPNPGASAALPTGRLAQGFGGDLGANRDREPGGQGHANQ